MFDGCFFLLLLLYFFLLSSVIPLWYLSSLKPLCLIVIMMLLSMPVCVCFSPSTWTIFEIADDYKRIEDEKGQKKKQSTHLCRVLHQFVWLQCYLLHTHVCVCVLLIRNEWTRWKVINNKQSNPTQTKKYSSDWFAAQQLLHELFTDNSRLNRMLISARNQWLVVNLIYANS